MLDWLRVRFGRGSKDQKFLHSAARSGRRGFISRRGPAPDDDFLGAGRIRGGGGQDDNFALDFQRRFLCGHGPMDGQLCGTTSAIGLPSRRTAQQS